eukprot:Nitzschia sp. Nitz4//scaffold79_size90958//53571//54341//NITZ4_005030-RA/size90958-processed-gene-0.116-mRNA-1//-1//CDS//3329558264//3927//frame0
MSDQTANVISQVVRNDIINKERDFYMGLKQNQANLELVAQRLALGGQVESLLQENHGTDLQEYRQKVKELAIQNVMHERQIQAFLGGIKQMVGKVNHESSDVDYPKAIKENIISAHENIENNAVNPEQESQYLRVCSELGETAANAADDDDDIAVLASEGTGPSLKCPISGMLMTNPWKNKICGHVYDKESILHHLKKDRASRCPVAGCNNSGISQSQLEEDMVTANLIRRQKIREQHQSQQQSGPVIDMDEDAEF